MTSKIAEEVYKMLKELFPYHNIEKEYYVFYKGSRLFFDFYISSLSLCFEIQGEQHFKYCRHFHGSIESFKAQKFRDNLKVEYVEENYPLTIVYFYDKIDKITEELILERIYEAMNE